MVIVIDAPREIPKQHKITSVLSRSRDIPGMDTPLVNPIVKPYYRDGFGSKSIGEPQWRPHPRNVLSMPETLNNSVRGGNGLDWFSSIRCPSVKDIKNSVRPRETAPRNNNARVAVPPREEAETLPARAPSRSKVGHRVVPPPAEEQHFVKYDTYDDFEKIYQRRPFEIALKMSLGVKRKVLDRRNGIAAASQGDKTYQVPEYSSDFHKNGSTRPVVNFGGSLKTVPDTFVPLQDLPLRPRPTFEEKERERLKRVEIMEVINLDQWRPADPLTSALHLPGTHG